MKHSRRAFIGEFAGGALGLCSAGQRREVAAVQAPEKPAVYITARRVSGAPDLAAETRLREEFTKRGAFRVASSLSGAAIVFLLVTEYEYNQAAVGGIAVGEEDLKSASAYVLPAAAWSEAKNDFDKIREAATWSHAERNGLMRSKKLPNKIAGKYHDSLKR